MKVAVILSALTTGIGAHTIFQRVSVNGVDQGQLKGVRAPYSDYPIQNVNDAAFACNKDLALTDSTVIPVPAGARVGAWWGHVIGGAQGANDPDNPIAKSHKGPIMVYLAKVDNAATAGTSGLKWFKVAESGLGSNGAWAVDAMITSQGWHYFDMPSCVAPGDYLMRVELLALHSAGRQGEAQFYMECAQIRITGSGTSTGSDLVSFPGAYSATHPGILVSIYDAQGNPNNGGRPYSIPGPPVLACSGAAGASSSSGGGGGGNNAPAASDGAAAGTVALYAQCGGTGYTGPTACVQGSCRATNEWYSQCVP